MSSKTRTRRNRTGTTGSPDSAQTPRSVRGDDQSAIVRTNSEDRLWKALHGNPNSTATDLASAANIGKSTAGKILAKWHKDGSATRTAGTVERGRRAPDLWAVTETDTAETAQDEPSTATVDSDTPDADGSMLVEEDLTEPVNVESAESTVSTGSTVAVVDGPQAVHDAEAEATTSTDAGSHSIEPTESAEDATSEDGTETVAGGDRKPERRLAPGALRGMVEDYLRDHPGEEFGPTAIAKALGGKSSGAVSNALDKLAADGTAAKAKDKPRRFTLAPEQQPTGSGPTP